MKRKKVNARTLVSIGMLSAVAVILMQFEIPLPFAPAFYQIDFSEIPVLIGSFALGPLASVAIRIYQSIVKYAYQWNDNRRCWGYGEFSHRLWVKCSGGNYLSSD